MKRARPRLDSQRLVEVRVPRPIPSLTSNRAARYVASAPVAQVDGDPTLADDPGGTLDVRA